MGVRIIGLQLQNVGDIRYMSQTYYWEWNSLVLAGHAVNARRKENGCLMGY